MTNKIAVIGPTGMLGTPVVKELYAAGFEVTALVRDEARAKAKLPAAIALVQGDIQNARALDKLLQGQEALYLSLNLELNARQHDWLPEREGLDIILAAARRNNIQRVGFLSSLVKNYQHQNGFYWWVFDMKEEAITKIKASGIPYTIFYPSAFMDNFESTYRRGNRLLLAGKSHHKMYFISGSDYGKQVARAFSLPQAANKEYVVQGQTGYTADEATLLYRNHYTKEKLQISRAPLGLIKLMGMFSPAALYGYHILLALNSYAEKFEAHETWQELGKPTTSLEEFAGRAAGK
jgi:uncharacterized protein YbjT (DUF2867 family)